MEAINLRSFKAKVKHHKRKLKIYLSKLEKKAPANLYTLANQSDKQVWKEVDCLTCANCCKTMSPTYTSEDMKRISAHLKTTVAEFKEKYLYRDKNKDWMNTKQPCQFLNLKDNKCSIYSIRPADCAGFPHHDKRKLTDYVHVYKQNIEYCPATYKWVEKLKELTQQQ